MISLGSTLNGSSFASSINNRGQIVGSSSNKHGSVSQAFLYSNGHMTPIKGKLPGTLPNHQIRPLVINDRDQIIGFATKSGNATVLGGGRFKNIGSLNGLGSVAEGINDQGAIVGYSYITPFHDIFNQGIQHAFLYQNGQMTDLGTLGGSYSEATAINNHGDVAGWSGTTGDLAQDAFLYHDGVMTDLGRLSGGSAAFPTAMNDKRPGGRLVLRGWNRRRPIPVQRWKDGRPEHAHSSQYRSHAGTCHWYQQSRADLRLRHLAQRPHGCPAAEPCHDRLMTIALPGACCWRPGGGRLKSRAVKSR